MLLAACGTVGGGEADSGGQPEILVAEGQGKVDPVKYADEASWAQAFQRPIEATADAALDASVGDPGQRVLAAQAAARRASLRSLGAKIQSLTDTQGRELATRVTSQPDLAVALGKLIEEQAKVNVAMADGQARATATLEGPAVMELFRKNGAPFDIRLSDLSTGRQQMLRQEAYNEALKAMRDDLKTRIMQVRDASGKPLEQTFSAHPERMKELDAYLVLVVQADEYRFQEDGSCLAQCYFDANIARRIARGESVL